MGDPFWSPLCVVFCIMRWHSCQSVIGLSILQDVVLGAGVVEVIVIHLQGEDIATSFWQRGQTISIDIERFPCYIY